MPLALRQLMLTPFFGTFSCPDQLPVQLQRNGGGLVDVNLSAALLLQQRRRF
eukprot:CAMPEP_0114687808 /NCGR_PEP_ID=MMETSP0191-20121206/62879_1 /TAXON_ID=126664 /ORGANISM="Sorites sp." /LENGTH=51 /DNA_ID=CAMNT_0001974723 /DNA_START=50 /DNA_END=205 /DNA_ORIENTATION=-